MDSTPPRFYRIRFVFFLALLFGFAAPIAAEPQNADDTRFALFVDEDQTNKHPEINLRDYYLRIVREASNNVLRIVDMQPQKQVRVRFIPARRFHEETAAPAWITAVYQRGEIIVPVPENEQVGYIQLERTLRHEYVHALVADYSGSRCPAWFDEGLAQYVEGQANGRLAPALRARAKALLPFTSLEKNFPENDELENTLAYAQSLFAAKLLFRKQDLNAAKRYLQFLGRGIEPGKAFRDTFGESLQQFETRLRLEVAAWAHSSAASF